MLRTLRSNYKWWRDKPTREYVAMLKTEQFYMEINREFERVADTLTIPQWMRAAKKHGLTS